MIKIIIKIWQTGLEKIALSKLQMSVLGISLSNAKHNVDKILDYQEVIVLSPNREVAEYFIAEAGKIGAICDLAEKDFKMEKLNNLESKIVMAILENNKLEYPFLLKHLPFLVVESREYTGVGSYTNFSYSERIDITPNKSRLLSSFQSLHIDFLQYDLAYVLDVEDGKITFLEIVTNGDEMRDGTYSNFTFE